MMRVSLSGMARNAARELRRLERIDEEGGDKDAESEQPGAAAYLLECLAGNCEDVRAGKETLAEFGRFYCLSDHSPPPEAPRLVIAAQPHCHWKAEQELARLEGQTGAVVSVEMFSRCVEYFLGLL